MARPSIPALPDTCAWLGLPNVRKGRKAGGAVAILRQPFLESLVRGRRKGAGRRRKACATRPRA